MNRFCFKVIVVSILGLLSCNSTAYTINPLDDVNPFIGTDVHRPTFPGATPPFGMIQVSPSNEVKTWDLCSGYHYRDNIIKEFAHSHISDAGLDGLDELFFLPTIGALLVTSGTEANPESGYPSLSSHENESASTRYYSVGKWTGWSRGGRIAEIDLGQSHQVNDFIVGFLPYPNIWINPPHNVDVCLSEDNESSLKIAEKHYSINKEHQKYPWITCDRIYLKGLKARSRKVEANNMEKIPDSHGASGHKPWLFIDEILLN